MSYKNTIDDLYKAYEAFNTRHELKPGMVVQWKDGMRTLSERGPFIVMAIGDDDRDFGREDIVLGYIDEDGDLIRTPCDSRRFEPITDAMSA